MDDKLYYEKTDVTNDSEVHAAYEYAVANNYKYYRAVTKSKAYFGWVDGHHVRAVVGQDWFENPLYKEQIKLQEVVLEKPIAELISARTNDPISEITESVSEIPVAEIPPVKYVTRELYEEKCAELEQYKTYCAAVEAELNDIKSAFAIIADEIKQAAKGGED